MKRIGLVAILVGLCMNVFAFEVDHAQLAQETKNISTELKKLILLPNQTLQCAGLLTKASGEIYIGSTFLKYKSLKLAKKAIEKGMDTLSTTNGLNCVGGPLIEKSQEELAVIDMKL